MYIWSVEYTRTLCAWIYHWTPGISHAKSQHLLFLILSCSCLCPINWNQVLSREWRWNWRSADMHLIIRGLTVLFHSVYQLHTKWRHPVDTLLHNMSPLTTVSKINTTSNFMLKVDASKMYQLMIIKFLKLKFKDGLITLHIESRPV